MKIVKKLTALITMIAILVVCFTGCAAKDKLELLNAFEKTSQLNSWESHSTVRFGNASLSTNVEELQPIQSYIPILNGAKIDIRQKINQNSERTISKTQTDMQFTIGDITQQINLWSASNFTQQDPQMLQVMRLPDIISASLPNNLAGKEYMIMDQADVGAVAGANPQSYTEMLESMKSIQTRIFDLLKEYAVKNDPNFAVITKLDDAVINGESFTAYRLKLDDKSLKVVLNYAMNQISENENAKNLIKELMLTVAGASGSTDAGQDLGSAFEELRDGTPFREDVKKIMSVMNNVRLLGNQGIVLNILINKDGYIVNQSGVIDLYMDSAQIENALEKLGGTENAIGEGGSNAVFRMAMYFNIDNYSLNRAVNIDFPQLTEQNSFKMSDISNITTMGSNIKVEKRSRNTELEVNSRTISKDIPPIKIGSRIFVPLEPLCKSLGIKYKANRDGTLKVTAGGKVIQLNKNSIYLTVGGEKQEMTLPVMSLDGGIYVPEQFVEKYLGANVYYNGASNKVIVKNK